MRLYCEIGVHSIIYAQKDLADAIGKLWLMRYLYTGSCWLVIAMENISEVAVAHMYRGGNSFDGCGEVVDPFVGIV